MNNHMAEVAKLLGVELGEYFKIVSDNGCSCCNCYRFTEEKGIEMSYDNANWEIATAGAGILKQLLMGEAMIAKFPWKPKKNEIYYFPCPDNQQLWSCDKWDDNDVDYYRLKHGLVFESIGEVAEAAKKMLAALQER